MVLPKNAADKLISWTEKRTNKTKLDELQTRRELLAQIIKRKLAFFGHARRNNMCYLVKTCILGMMPGKRRRGHPRIQYIGNIKKWKKASLEENVRLTEDRTAWRERSCAAGAANVSKYFVVLCTHNLQLIYSATLAIALLATSNN